MYKNIPKNPIKFGLYISGFHKKWAVPTLICVIIATFLGGRILVVILKNLTDAIAAKPFDINAVWLWAITYPFLLLISESIWRCSGFLGMRWFVYLRSTAYESLYEHLTLHSKDYFNSRFAGSLANKIGHAVDGTEQMFEKILWQFIPLFLGLLLFIGISWINDFRLGIIMAVWSCVFLLLNLYFSKLLQPHSYKYAKATSVLKGKFVDSLSNISLVHEYAFVTGEKEYIKKFVDQDKEANLSLWNTSEWIIFVNGVLICLFTGSMIITSVFLFQKGIISIGAVVMIVAIVGNVSDQFLFIGQEMANANRYFGEAQEGLEEILKEHVIIDSPDAKPLDLRGGNITIDSMSFDYENIKVFSNFSLQIPHGQKVGLVGRSGAGKTTFVSLLLRHYDIKSGQIKIDGQNIADVTLESLRKIISFVPQDTGLFHRTIRENISYSNTDASLDDIKKASRLAHANEFIEDLPKQYDTMVGERGVKLSGGQRQRIAIARAFLKNSPILILDEATSSLDSESEQAIQVSLQKLMKGRTVIAIAHRLSTLKEMDRIVVIENGKIAEDGAPDELLRKPKGVFKSMWEHQIHGFITDD